MRPVVIVAMQSELQHLVARLELISSHIHGPWTTDLMRLPHTDAEVSVIHGGIGMINAAAAAEFACDRLSPTMILNYGCAGAHTRDQLPGDVVIGSATYHQGAFHILTDGTLHYPETEYGVTTDKVVPNLRPCDAHLLQTAIDVTAGWTPTPWPTQLPWPKGVPRRDQRVQVGTVASADIWTQQTERIDRMHSSIRSLCEDMEAAAMNRVSSRWNVPFMTVKDISNNEFLEASDLIGDIEVLPESQVGLRSAEVILRMLAALHAEH